MYGATLDSPSLNLCINMYQYTGHACKVTHILYLYIYIYNIYICVCDKVYLYTRVRLGAYLRPRQLADWPQILIHLTLEPPCEDWNYIHGEGTSGPGPRGLDLHTSGTCGPRPRGPDLHTWGTSGPEPSRLNLHGGDLDGSGQD